MIPTGVALSELQSTEARNASAERYRKVVWPIKYSRNSRDCSLVGLTPCSFYG